MLALPNLSVATRFGIRLRLIYWSEGKIYEPFRN